MGEENKFTVLFEFEKETKNTFRYAERVEGEQPARIGTLYVQKSALGGGSPPPGLTVTVEVRG